MLSFEYCMNVQDRVHFKYRHEKHGEYGEWDESVLTNHVHKFTMNAAFEYSI